MILVTGASGAMGSVLVRGLNQKGLRRRQRIRACVLPGDRSVDRIKGLCEVNYGDISVKSSISGMCSGVGTVYHLAAIILSNNERDFERINVQGTKNLIGEAQLAGVEHFIYISSASVTYPRPTPYSLSKRKAEELVRDSGLNYTIIRPTLVYGPAGGQEFDSYLDYLLKFPVVPFVGNGRALKRPVFVGDIMGGLLALNDCRASYGKTYNFSGAETISMLGFSRLCLRLLNKPSKPIMHIPVWACRLIAWSMKLFMKDPPLKWQTIAGIIQDADLDPSEAARDLCYHPVKITDMLPTCFPRKKTVLTRE